MNTIRVWLAEIPSAFRKFIINAIFAVIFTAIGIVLLNFVSPYVPANYHDANGAVSSAAALRWLYDLTQVYPLYAAAVLVCTLIGVFLLVYAFRATTAFTRLFASRRLVKLVGLSGFWRHAQPGKGHPPWERLQQYICRPGNQFIYILGATGVETFGAEGSPLWEPIRNFTGEVRVILMSPDCEYLRERAGDLGVSVKDYKRQIATSLEQLQNWRRNGHNISHRTYNAPPNWKIILTNEMAWVQYYRFNKHVADSPVYQFYATENQTGMYHLYFAEFMRVWRLCGADSGADPARVEPVRGVG